MSEDSQESLDLFDDHEEVVSEDGKKVTRRGIYLLPNLLTTASLFSGFFSIVSAINGNFIASGMAIPEAMKLPFIAETIEKNPEKSEAVVRRLGSK